MLDLFKAGLAIVFLIIQLPARAQMDQLFAPYDCREHAASFYEIPVFESIVLDSSLLVETEPEPVIATDTINGWKTWTLVENYTFGKDRGTLPMITDLEALHPYFRDKVVELIKLCKDKGIELAVVETYRTHAKQNEYRGMGRKYTNTGGGRSKHQYGLAIDVVPIVDSAAVWDNVALWKKIGVTGEKLGLRWGGRWKKPYDPCHFEWTGGLTSYHLSQGELPVIPDGDEHYPCLHDDIRTLRKYWKEWETAQSMMTRK